jgi:hypothetical protein
MSRRYAVWPAPSARRAGPRSGGGVRSPASLAACRTPKPRRATPAGRAGTGWRSSWGCVTRVGGTLPTPWLQKPRLDHLGWWLRRQLRTADNRDRGGPQPSRHTPWSRKGQGVSCTTGQLNRDREAGIVARPRPTLDRCSSANARNILRTGALARTGAGAAPKRGLRGPGILVPPRSHQARLSAGTRRRLLTSGSPSVRA